MKKCTAILVMCWMIIAGAGCSKEYSASGWQTPADSFNLVVKFKPMADAVPLKLNDPYRNFWDESYTPTAFRFYVCRFDLINTDSGLVRPINYDKYFLVDASDSSTWTVKLLVTPFRYNRISFMIGVDSTRNVSGAQTGALDPAKGMFWTWNSGYIMAKLEGTSPVSSLPNGKFEYHIGGFKGAENVLRKPVLLFPFGQFSEITQGKKCTMTIEANINAWFYNPHEIKIQNTPSCTTPGSLATDISENYSKMFTVTEITN